MIRTLKTVVLAALLGLCLAPQAKAEVQVARLPASCSTAAATHWSFVSHNALMTVPNSGTPSVDHFVLVYQCYTDAASCNAARTALANVNLSQAVGAGPQGNLYLGRTLYGTCIQEGVGF